MPTEIYTTREAAAYVGLSLPGFLHYVNAGRVPCEIKGNLRLFTREDLDTFQALPRKAGRPRKGEQQ